MAFAEILGVVSTAVVTALAVGTIVGVARLHERLKNAKAAAEAQKFQQAIESDDISTLGRYLEEELGKVAVAEYERSLEVAMNVDNYLNRIDYFLAGERDGDVAPPPEQPSQLALVSASDLEEPWNALAKLRRRIEAELKALAAAQELPVRRQGAGAILTLIQRSHPLPHGLHQRLAYAIQIANRAIHGEDVPQSQVQEALEAGYAGLTELAHYRENLS